MTPPRFRSTSLHPNRRHALSTLTGSLGAGLALAALGLLPGCATGARLVAQRAELITPGAIRVLLLGVDGNLVKVDIFNQTSAPMLVYRDQVLLSTSTGMRARMQGGVGHVYTIPPGGVQKLHVHYDLYGLRPGDQVAMIFQNAIAVNGQPVPVEPLPLLVQ